MRYYKVMKDNKVIDVLDQLIYIKWQEKHNIPVLCDINEAQGILSSDNNTIWHEETLYELPVDVGEYDTVRVEEISKYEHDQLKMLGMKTPEEIIDAFVLSLLEENII